MSLQVFLDEISVAARLHAEYRGLQFTAEPVDRPPHVDVDKQLLASALMNLLQNAFKYTHDHGRVTLRAHFDGGPRPHRGRG